MLDDQPDRLSGAEANFLGQDERLRLAGLRFEKRRMEWLLGRWTAKQLLRRCGQEQAGIQVANEEGGQPNFVSREGARLAGCLSISHRSGRAACAWSAEAGIRLGIDLEILEPRDPIFIEDYLGVREQAAALACRGLRRDLCVTLAWSAKEAVFKALGTGLRMDTRSVDAVGLDWLAEDGLIEPGWMALRMESAQVEGPIQAWWRLEGALILTVAVLGPLAVELTGV